MKCSHELLEAYLDQELDALQIAAVQQHMAECAGCSEDYARLRRQKAGIQAAAPYYSAPAGLLDTVQEELRRASAGKAKSAAQTPWRWLAIAASMLLAASLSWNVLQFRSRQNDLAEAVVTDHIRSVLGSRLVDVPSSDQHTVKPWFAGKLDFAPEVRDLEAQGFSLLGGRVEYLAGRRVAALVYRRRQHVINLFIWPGDSAGGPGASTSRNGYSVLHWTSGPMSYWAVSDISPADLERLRELYK